ncbi:hypothetical protein FB451DRAFT_1415300 [Mycena latifolia]|nr:hypothetical protein FB451DRAFT_1415300 [Mycena latifolia]
MTENLGFGKARRRAGNLEILVRTPHRRLADGFREMLENIKLDPGFKDLHAWCSAQDIPVVIVSSGMAPNIHAVLSELVGEEVADTIDIADVEIAANGKWAIRFRYPSSGYGHNKSRAILPYKDLASPPLLFGDGVTGAPSFLSDSQHLAAHPLRSA